MRAMDERQGPPPRRNEVEGVEGKGSMWRGYLASLENSGLLSSVRERASERTREMMDRPPPVSAWISVTALEEVIDIVEQLQGAQGIRDLTREASLLGVAPLIRTLLQGLMRAFGVSPATLFARLGQISSTTVRGVEYQYVAIAEREGELILRYPKRASVPWNVFVAVSGSLEAVYEFCGMKGNVSEPRPLTEGTRNNGARYKLSW